MDSNVRLLFITAVKHRLGVVVDRALQCCALLLLRIHRNGGVGLIDIILSIGRIVKCVVDAQLSLVWPPWYFLLDGQAQTPRGKQNWKQQDSP